MLYGGWISSGLEGSDFAHEGVKQVVGLFIGFVFAIACAPCGFLYLNQRIHDKKKEKKKKSEKAPYCVASLSSAPPAAIEISTP